MSKLLKLLPVAAVLVTAPFIVSSAQAGDVSAGEKVFKKCAACHAVGDGAKNKVGPHLNDVFGRKAGELDGFKYSKAMSEAGSNGLIWDEATMATFLAKPKDMIKGTKMSFAGLRKQADIENILAYLATFSAAGATEDKAEAPAEPPAETVPTQTAAANAGSPPAKPVSNTRDGGIYGIGRVALPEEIAAWDIDIRPDGTGLPVGSGTVSQGEPVFAEKCAMCHGDFGEGVGRWPVLAGGHDTLTEERPEKTIGSYWPYLSTVYDYVRRAMPFGDARSLTNDEVYAITAYLLYLNDVVEDENFELSNENFTSVRLPNEDNFIADDRHEEPVYAEKKEPCMSDCTDEPVKITMRARVLDVTPDAGDNDNSGAGTVD